MSAHPNLCVDCLHCATVTSPYQTLHFCTRRPPDYDRVTGATIDTRTNCHAERNSHSVDMCGPEGAFFQSTAPTVTVAGLTTRPTNAGS